MRNLVFRSVVTAFLMLAASLPASAHEKDQCEATEGPFTSVLVPPPECTSPVGLCTHGILQGDLEATYDFVADSIVPDTDPAHPGRLLYTGTSVITPTKGPGQMFSDDH